jgi:hypothetical protein
MNAEQQRLEDVRSRNVDWRKWGPYLSERQWGTVREDYSTNGNSWDYFTHDQARSRAYRWGEDGLGGICDSKQQLCFALALWNGADPILKERLFGLTNAEGNHGEDVKEYYFYLDSTPTHSYMRYLYKYPQSAFPYEDLLRSNSERNRLQPEHELLDTGIFDEDRYFDVFVEYAKCSAEDIFVRITVFNRGPASAKLHLLPTLWFRNTWSSGSKSDKPELGAGDAKTKAAMVVARHSQLGEYRLWCEGSPALLFTENETNNRRLFGTANGSPYVKDGINEFIVNGRQDAVNPKPVGTKAAVHYALDIGAGQSAVVRLRLSAAAAGKNPRLLAADFDEVVEARRGDADAFYESITPTETSADARNVMRQALAGMLWTKQYYYFDLDRWLEEHGAHPLQGGWSDNIRNRGWFHMLNSDVISMPDKWEYPWYAAWDLAFHTVAFNMVDPDFAREQLNLMLSDTYLHPNGQIPAYEWNFGDVNPPVHAWATLFAYHTGKQLKGEGDLQFLRTAFQKLLLNFTWWVNRKDPTGRNVFEGGFLGLDNIGVFDRSNSLPTGGSLEQADGTAWMALFAQNMLEIALELAAHDRMYEEIALRFVEHFYWIAASMDRIGEQSDEMWDEEDGFFYDVLRLPDGSATRLKVRSLVGLLPLCATTVLPGGIRKRFPALVERAEAFLKRHPELAASLNAPDEKGFTGRGILAVVNEKKLRRILGRMLDENEFLGSHGIRSLSRAHLEHPYSFNVHGTEYKVQYLPGESDSGMFGGNSNWRGPVWFPVNLLIIRALLQFYLYHGDAFTIECPTGSGRQMTLFEVARELAERLIRTFTRGEDGRRPVYGGSKKFQDDPHWRDYLLFFEYFHGDTGAGVGASHQTGWTGVVARLIQLFSHVSAEEVLEGATRPMMNAYRH